MFTQHKTQEQGATFNIVKVYHSRTDLTSCTTPDSVDATMRTISESWFEQPQPLYWSGLLSEASIPVAVRLPAGCRHVASVTVVRSVLCLHFYESTAREL